MSIADAGVKEQMPDDAPEVGAKLKANMAQPVRKGVAKWTDTVRKLTVRQPLPSRGITRGPIALPASSSHALGSRRVRRGAQVGEEVEVLETQLNEENGQIRCESLRDVPQQRSAKQRRRPWEMIGRSFDKLTPPAARRVRIADGWASLTDTFGEPLLEPC